jgi:hypothetical protein
MCKRPVAETQSISTCFNNMHDGRMFTDYRPRCTVAFENAGSQKSSYLSRQELIHNAEKLMSQSASLAEKRSICKQCFAKDAPGTMLPEANMQKCDARSCSFKQNVVPNGLGTGRAYS